MISAARVRTGLYLLASFGAGTAGAQATITVSPHGPVRTLTAAIASAPRHAKIILMPGIYREPTIVVNKPVEISGEGWPVLDGASARQIMTVTADSVRCRGLQSSTQDGRFTGNNFIGNTFDVSANNSETTTIFARNYWDDYRGYDLDHDGL